MTSIALIPKVKDLRCVIDFRPISLYNVIYKLISKIIANRLKKILPHIISPVQSAFVPERLIIDNVLVAYETIHTMHTQLKGKKGFMAVKLDMSKAYNKVEWRGGDVSVGFCHEVDTTHYNVCYFGPICNGGLWGAMWIYKTKERVATR
jgi:hypothetical protein